MTSAISTHNLGKKYILSHKSHEQYTALRDVIANRVKNAARKLRHPFSEPAIDAAHEEFWALKDVSFDIQQGDRVGIIGRNGAGKSTLLKVLSRITEPTEGKAKIRGRVASLLEVGTGFHPELTGRENIYLNGAILGMSKAEIKQKFDEIVAFAEVEKFLDTAVKRYSSGMYVRLAFAVAAHLEPEVLIVDEVLAVGDAQFQQKCLGRMEQLGNSGRTILFVTHNMDAMLALCNRGLVIDKGSVVFDGAPLGARQHYLSEAASAEYSVAQNAGRGGSGSAHIERVWIEFNDPGSAMIQCGEPLSIHLIAHVEENYRARPDLQVAFSINSLDGQRLYTVISSWDGTIVDASSGEIRVVSIIESIPLIPGKYLVDATIIFRGDTFDCVIHCAAFEVLPRPRPIHVERLPGWGHLDLPCKFRNF